MTLKFRIKKKKDKNKFNSAIRRLYSQGLRMRMTRSLMVGIKREDDLEIPADQRVVVPSTG